MDIRLQIRTIIEVNLIDFIIDKSQIDTIVDEIMVVVENKKPVDKNEFQLLAQEYVLKIHPLRSKNNVVHINTQARSKISSRLSEYTLEELLKAIDKFSKNDWQMKNNAHRGLAWFFHSEDRIEKFLALPEDKVVSSKNGINKWKIGEKEYGIEELKAAEETGEIVYTDGKYIPGRIQS